MTYTEKLRDSRWQKRRLQLMEVANWACQHCGSADKQLQVHHLWYHRKSNPWDYDDSLLVVLCNTCHVERQEAETRLYSAIAIATRLVPGKNLEKYAHGMIREAFTQMEKP